MRKLLLLFIIASLFISISNNVSAQQHSLFSQYMLNDLFINPAIAGSKKYSPLQLGVSRKWVGINDAPSIQTLSFHTLLPNNHMGLGGVLFNETFGPESKLNVQAMYAYHFNIDKKNRIALGLGLSLMRYKVDQRNFNMGSYFDPSINYEVVKSMVPDANFGIYAYGEKYFGSFSIMNLFQSPLKINKNTSDNYMIRHYFLMGGYKFTLPNDVWEIEPSLLLKMTEQTRPQIDINAKFYFDKNFWFGASFRPNDAFIANVGFKYKQFYASYAYDFTFSALSRHTYGSQEIIFGMNIGEDTRKRRSFY